MSSHDMIELPPLPRLQVPLIEADVSLIDIKVLAKWCERTATAYARAAVLADREQRAQPSAEPVAWQYRWRAVHDDGTLGDWNEWQPGRAPKTRTNIYQQQERPLFAHPSPADEAVRLDAARYRWLRDANINTLPYDDHGIGPEFPCGDDLDAAIDEAMKKENKV